MRHDIRLREMAIELMDCGYGRKSLSEELAISETIAEKWILTYRTAGKEKFLDMGSSHRVYDYETKLAAARDHVDGGMTMAEVMERHGIASIGPLQKWFRAYREGGPDALRPKPKGRPPGSGGKHAAKTREQELEERVRYLEAENAYLKKCRALMAGKASRGGRRPGS